MYSLECFRNMIIITLLLSFYFVINCATGIYFTHTIRPKCKFIRFLIFSFMFKFAFWFFFFYLSGWSENTYSTQRTSIIVGNYEMYRSIQLLVILMYYNYKFILFSLNTICLNYNVICQEPWTISFTINQII